MEVGHKPTIAHRKHPGSAIRLQAFAGVLDRGGGLTVIGGIGAEYMVEQARAQEGVRHDLLAVASRNTVLSGIMRSLRERTSLAFILNSRPRALQDWKEHAGVLAAVIDGDEDLAELLATRHVQNAAAAFAAAAPEKATA